MENYIKNAVQKADILLEAMPYIAKFHNKIVVIKYGGSAMTDEKIKSSVIGDIAFMKMVGIKPVIIHGGGPEINTQLEISGIKPNFVNGLRITDAKTIKIVERVLSGGINKNIVSEFQKHNIKACGISGKDGLLIQASRKDDEIDLGYVGKIDKVNPEIIISLLDSDFVPVISPVSGDENGNTYNVNADIAAVEIAVRLNASKLVFLTDVEGIRKDEKNPDSLISRMNIECAQKLLKNKNITGGMIPKTKCCIKAVCGGVNSVHIINGKINHSILLEIYTKDGIGTILEEN